jgi:hypothetical protein
LIPGARVEFPEGDDPRGWDIGPGTSVSARSVRLTPVHPGQGQVDAQILVERGAVGGPPFDGCVYAVGTLVNRATYDGPRCVEPE